MKIADVVRRIEEQFPDYAVYYEAPTYLTPFHEISLLGNAEGKGAKLALTSKILGLLDESIMSRIEERLKTEIEGKLCQITSHQYMI